MSRHAHIPPEPEPLVWPREQRRAHRWLSARAWIVWSLCLMALGIEVAWLMWVLLQRGGLAKPDPFAIAQPKPEARTGVCMSLYEGGAFQKFWGMKRMDGELVVPIDGNTFKPPFPFWNMSARFTGRLIVPQAGSYQFFLAADDGARLYIDDHKLVDSWPSKTLPGLLTDPMQLTKGEHPMVLEVSNTGGTGWLALEWIPPGGARRVLKGSDFIFDPSAAKEAP